MDKNITNLKEKISNLVVKLKQKSKKSALEGGTADFWEDDIDSEIDDEWNKAANKILKGNNSD